MMALGTNVRGGYAAQFPGLGTLDDNGNLLVPTDFRSVYQETIASWLGGDPTAVLPGGPFPAISRYDSGNGLFDDTSGLFTLRLRALLARGGRARGGARSPAASLGEAHTQQAEPRVCHRRHHRRVCSDRPHQAAPARDDHDHDDDHLRPTRRRRRARRARPRPRRRPRRRRPRRRRPRRTTSATTLGAPRCRTGPRSTSARPASSRRSTRSTPTSARWRPARSTSTSTTTTRIRTPSRSPTPDGQQLDRRRPRSPPDSPDTPVTVTVNLAARHLRALLHAAAARRRRDEDDDRRQVDGGRGRAQAPARTVAVHARQAGMH